MTSMGGASRFLTLLSTPFPLLYPRPATLRLTRHSRFALFSSSLYSTYTTTTTPAAYSLPSRPRRPFSHPHPPPPSTSPGFSTRVAAVGDDCHGQSGVVEIGPSSHPWPEFSKLVEHSVACGYSGCHEDDVFDEEYAVPGEFNKAADACLSFARARPDLLRLLSKKDVEVVVGNGSPFLFKNGSNSARRMGSSFGEGGAAISKSEVADTADLMRYLLSYAYNHFSSLAVSNAASSEYVESSVRNLLSEVVDRSKIDSYHTETDNRREPFNLEVAASNPRQNIEMKRGDWICPKCSFLNFARNMKCLECEEARPNRQLTGGEWECPQCDFFNYGRNMACLRCDCRRPEKVPARAAMPEVTSDSNGKPSIGHFFSSTTSNQSEIERKLADNDAKAERWFKKVSQLGDSSDLSGAVDDEDFPEIMPLRKEENRFAPGTQKTPLERRSADDQYKRDFVSDGSNESYQTPYGREIGTTEDSVSKTLDEIFGQSPGAVRDSNSAGGTKYSQGSAVRSENFEQLPDSMKESSDSSERWSKQVAELDGARDLASAIPDKDFPEIMPLRKGENRFVISRKKDRSLTSPQYKRRLAMEQANNSNFVPFVPFPPGYFAKKDNQSETGDSTKKAEADPVTFPVTENIQHNPEISIQASNGGPSDGFTNSFESGHLDHANRNVGSSGQSWKSTTSTRSAGNARDNNKESWNFNSSQGDFSWGGASNGENQGFQGQSFGGRTGNGDPQQSWNSNREQWNSQGGNFDGVNGSAGNPNPSWNANRDDWNSQGRNFGGSTGAGNPNPSWNNGRENWVGMSASTSWNNDNLKNGNSQGGVSTGTNARENAAAPFNNNNSSWKGDYSSQRMTSTNLPGSPPQQPNVSSNTAESWKGSFSGKSLEGSAVTEPDPLDMSEEAKAQRWFRRVAQITDISELSNIPDEDFPSIMPMRKGVNRFVVSKRKTPLERRLTSPQYRRNLPVVSSEPDKDDNSNV